MYPPLLIEVHGRGGHKDGTRVVSKVNVSGWLSRYNLATSGCGFTWIMQSCS